MAVHFTKQQIDEIEQALIARSKRDSQFPGADELDGTELIPIVQNGVNKIMTYSGLWNKVAADLQEYVEESLETKVDKVEGKELSTNDFDDDYKDKLDHIQAGAEVNVQSDWTAESGDAFILHKPDLSIYATNARVEDIEALIPNAASTSNQLADKSFVNSSIATNTAEFKGTYDTLEELMTVVANLNDYGFVRNIDSVGNVTFDRYKYTSNNTWLYEYSLNNSSFTQAQWDAINSGITAALVTKLNGIESAAQVNIIEGVQVDGSDLPITNKKVNVVLSGKVDKVAGKGLSTNDYTNSEKLKLGAFPAWSEVETSINSKVDKSGSETKDEVFTYQQTGGGLTIDGKNARIRSIYGKTLAWNQLVKNGNFATGDTNGWSAITSGTISVANNVLSYSWQSPYSNNGIEQVNCPIIASHKYYIAGTIKNTADDRRIYYLAFPYDLGFGVKDYFSAGQTTRIRGISTAPANSGGQGMKLTIYGNTNTPNSIEATDIVCVDLTLMFGSGNEPSTVEEFESLFPESYYPYNAGTLISNEAKEIESVGFNLLDEELDYGYWNISNGAWVANNTGTSEKNKIPVLPNTKYYVKKASAGDILYYDVNGNYLSLHDASIKDSDITTPSGCHFIAINWCANGDCVNRYDASFNGQYEPYRKSTLHIGLNNIRVKSHNIWDEEWEVGMYDSANGNKYADSTRIRSVNRIGVLPSTTYCFRLGSTNGCNILYYDANDAFIPNAMVWNVNTFTTPANARYIRFYMSQSYGATYNNDICINLSSSFNGQYEPHGILTIEGGLKGVNDVKDEIIGNKLVKRVGEVDLGTLSYSAGYGGFYTASLKNLANFTYASTTQRILSARYEWKTYNQGFGSDSNCIFSSSDGVIVILDSGYSSVQGFKAAMSGVYLIYELATPVEYELVSELPTDYPVDKLGTERVISDNICPFLAEIDYHEANVTDIQVEGITDYLKKAELKKELNTELTKLEGIESWSPVIAAAFAKLQSEIDSLKELLNDYQLKVKAESVDVLEYKIAGMPRILYSSTAGAPSASNVPDNWDESTMNGWSGVPRFIGQLYLDKPGKKVYFAAAVTNSTGDWVVLN